MWSYNFNKIDSEKDKKVIIINTINYGNLEHWRWLHKTYGSKKIINILSKIPVSELRKEARELAGIIFNIKKFNYAPRGS